MHSVQVARATDNYFDMSFPERVKFLGAPSVWHLCKTIILQNSHHQAGLDAFPGVKDDPTYPKHVICVVQYKSKHISQKVLTAMKKHQHENSKTGVQVSTKGFHFRHAEEEDAKSMSGYEFNAITPFFMTGGGEKLPIILSQEIAELSPPYLWFSGGRI